ncbi:MAG TPA: alanine racemase [Oligoflexia bacterium]|nr:alanine racemase [Oligoflexia bacterium]HMP49588.1 alanine racemase [Oligoflexia bacterium]
MLENPTIRFDPILAPWIKTLLRMPDYAGKIVERYGSPLHIINEEMFHLNIAMFQSSLGLIKSKIFYARKANKLSYFVKKAIDSGCGVDCASLFEVKDSFENGASPENLFVTAAIKNNELLEYCITSDICISLDNLDELEQCEEIAKRNNKIAKVAIRICDFPLSPKYSRFGFSYNGIVNLIERVEASFGLGLEGLHFHLNGYSLEERTSALDCCLSLAALINSKGGLIKFVDIGGGIPVTYLSEGNSIKDFKEELCKALKNERTPLTFNNNGLGLYIDSAKKIYGDLNLYPFYHSCPKNMFIDDLLESKANTGRTLASEIIFQNIELRLELGRSLLDQCGCTLARVAFRKQNSAGDWLIGLEMNFTNMLTSSNEYLVDPILFSNSDIDTGNFDCFFVGNFCLERDFIFKRKISLSRKPNIGDIILIPNTAGYFMHFHETEGHEMRLPNNIKLTSNGYNLFTDEI